MSDDDDDDYDPNTDIKEEEEEEASNENGTASKKKKQQQQPRRPTKKRRVQITQEEIQAESTIPSCERLTANGGYAATAAHRKKIGLANAGKEPWNKGKNRSEADRQKIKAAVQARNRRQLLANLASVQMSEEEYLVYKRKIKLLRENVRKAKILVKNKRETEKMAAQKTQLLEKQGIKEEEAEEDDEYEQEDSVKEEGEKGEGIEKEKDEGKDETKIPARETADETFPAVPLPTTMEQTPPPTAAAAASVEASNTCPLLRENTSSEAMLEQKIKNSWTRIWAKAGPTTNKAREQPVVASELAVHHESVKEAATAANIPTEKASLTTKNHHLPASDTASPVSVTNDAITQDDDSSMVDVARKPESANEIVGDTHTMPHGEVDGHPKHAPSENNNEQAFDIECVPEIFRRDFEWSPHSVFGFGEESLEGKCPNGGPGGLICCPSCTKTYSDYLDLTFSDLETQKVNKLAAELETINDFIQTNQERLSKSVRAARRLKPPSKLGET